MSGTTGDEATSARSLASLRLPPDLRSQGSCCSTGFRAASLMADKGQDSNEKP